MAFLAATGALFLYIPLLQYREIRIEGLTTLSTEDVTRTAAEVVDSRRLLIIPGRHVVFMHGKKLTASLMTAYNFADLALRRDGRTLVISAQERITQIAWASGESLSLVDLAGIAVSEANPEVRASIDARKGGAGDAPPAPGLQPTMPIIEDAKAGPVVLGATVLSAEKIARILELDAALRQRSIPPRSYLLDDAGAAWMTVRTDSVSLLVDLGTSVPDTMAMFDAFRSERSDGLETFSYIDLRFGNHVYIQSNQ